MVLSKYWLKNIKPPESKILNANVFYLNTLFNIIKFQLLLEISMALTGGYLIQTYKLVNGFELFDWYSGFQFVAG